MIYWIEFHQKPIVAVRSSLAYIVRWHLTSPRHLKQTHRKDMDHGKKKFTRGVTGQYWSIPNNIMQCLTISGYS